MFSGTSRRTAGARSTASLIKHSLSKAHLSGLAMGTADLIAGQEIVTALRAFGPSCIAQCTLALDSALSHQSGDPGEPD